MDRWKKIEISLLVGLAAVLLFAGKIDGMQNALSNQLLRLHVIANSDTDEDQAIKLKVRDQILAETEVLLDGETDLAAAEAKLNQNLNTLEAAGQKILDAEGVSYTVKASLEHNVWFPTREYEDFSLPAGNYTALRVVLGEGSGENWWCVLFPPLCTGVTTETFQETAKSAGLTGDQVAMITGEDEGFVLQFKCIEIWETVKHWFF